MLGGVALLTHFMFVIQWINNQNKKFFLVLFNNNPINTFECYYCNDEQGYYCPQPFPTKTMFDNNEKYSEQINNIAVSSSNNLLTEPIISCFVRKMILIFLKYISILS
jgi:hypothetical protein